MSSGGVWGEQCERSDVCGLRLLYTCFIAPPSLTRSLQEAVGYRQEMETCKTSIQIGLRTHVTEGTDDAHTPQLSWFERATHIAVPFVLHDVGWQGDGQLW